MSYKQSKLDKIKGSHGGEGVDVGLLGYKTVRLVD
jgi:hypothetical protein